MEEAALARPTIDQCSQQGLDLVERDRGLRLCGPRVRWFAKYGLELKCIH